MGIKKLLTVESCYKLELLATKANKLRRSTLKNLTLSSDLKKSLSNAWTKAIK